MHLSNHSLYLHPFRGLQGFDYDYHHCLRPGFSLLPPVVLFVVYRQCKGELRSGGSMRIDADSLPSNGL